jgi:lipoate-protein ligase A
MLYWELKQRSNLFPIMDLLRCFVGVIIKVKKKVSLFFGKMLSSLSHRTFARIIYSENNNPHLNLAHELSLLFDKDKHNDNTLYLWRNKPVVVIGKHQNPYKECNREYMKAHDIVLARRPTGGGAVYQDLGNTCWTFLSKNFAPKLNNEVIIDALKKFNINAYATGRNDIELDRKKISGAAFRITPDLSIHHGTMLLDVNLSDMVSALTVDRQKLTAKGVESVKSRVMNLVDVARDITHEKFCDSLMDSYKKVFGNCELIRVNAADVLSDDSVNERFKTLTSIEWLYGKNSDAKAQASKKFSFGLFDLTIQVHGSGIECIYANTDCLHNDLTESFNDTLEKCAVEHSTDPLNDLPSLFENEKKPMASELVVWASREISKFL